MRIGIHGLVLAILALAIAPAPPRALGGESPRKPDAVSARLATFLGDWRGVTGDPPTGTARHHVVRGPGASFLWSAEWGAGNVLWHAQAWRADDGGWRLHVLGMHGQPIEGVVTADGDDGLALSWDHEDATGKGRQGFVARVRDGALLTRYVTWHGDGTTTKTEVGRSFRGPAAPPLPDLSPPKGD